MTELAYGGRVAQERPDATSLIGNWWRSVDQWTLWAIGLLFLIGMVMGLAASPVLAERNGLPHFHYVIRQGVFGVGALVICAMVSTLSARSVKRMATLGFAVFLVAVALLPIFGTDFGKGATRWYSLGFGSLQPSEFLKPFFVVFAAWLLSASAEENGPPGALLSVMAAGLVAALLALQPDFGQASLLLAVWGAMYFAAGAPTWLLAALASVVVSVGVFAYGASEHFARRIDAYLSSDIEPQTQLAFATDAIMTGGLFGVGVGEGQVKRSLPDAHTDFVIAVAAEEYGLLFCVIIIGLFVFVVLRALRKLMREPDAFIRLAGVGLATLFGLQALVNMGVATRLFPAKGMTLPLVSYGGSSALAIGIGLGMMLALTRRRAPSETRARL